MAIDYDKFLTFAKEQNARKQAQREKALEGPSIGKQILNSMLMSTGTAVGKALSEPVISFVKGDNYADRLSKQFWENEEVRNQMMNTEMAQQGIQEATELQKKITSSGLSAEEWHLEQNAKEILEKRLRDSGKVLNQEQAQTYYRVHLPIMKQDKLVQESANMDLKEYNDGQEAIRKFQQAQTLEEEQGRIVDIATKNFRRGIFQRGLDKITGVTTNDILNNARETFLSSSLGEASKEAAAFIKNIQENGGDVVDGLNDIKNLYNLDDKGNKIPSTRLTALEDKISVKKAIERGDFSKTKTQLTSNPDGSLSILTYVENMDGTISTKDKPTVEKIVVDSALQEKEKLKVLRAAFPVAEIASKSLNAEGLTEFSRLMSIEISNKNVDPNSSNYFYKQLETYETLLNDSKYIPLTKDQETQNKIDNAARGQIATLLLDADSPLRRIKNLILDAQEELEDTTSPTKRGEIEAKIARLNKEEIDFIQSTFKEVNMIYKTNLEVSSSPETKQTIQADLEKALSFADNKDLSIFQGNKEALRFFNELKELTEQYDDRLNRAMGMTSEEVKELENKIQSKYNELINIDI